MYKKLIGVLLVLVAVPAMAVPISYPDNNETDNFWDRPVGVGPVISTLGPVEYHVQAFYTDTSDLYEINQVQDGWDGYIHVYEGSFDPLDQLTGLIAADNDGFGGIGTSDIVLLALDAFSQYFIITSGFEAGEAGIMTTTITDQGGAATISLGLVPATPVPEPATLLLMGLGLVGLSVRRRKI